ncbi:MAG: hypothetical protein EAZ33_24575 [Oscillatoriales cyanobacterium]|nr:MAG: hypothetical protein EAZ33_24575 [Oscillatoriales cyanobacterium]
MQQSLTIGYKNGVFDAGFYECAIECLAVFLRTGFSACSTRDKLTGSQAGAWEARSRGSASSVCKMEALPPDLRYQAPAW